MRRTYLLPLIAAAALAGAAVPAIAQSVDQPAHTALNLTGFSGEPGALAGAVTSIEGVSNGQVVEIRYNSVAGVPGYDVVLAKGSQISFLRFDKPTGGLVTLTDKTEPAWMLNWTARDDISLVRNAKVKLPDAIRAAEAARGNAPAVAAGMARSAAGANTAVKAYNVAIVKDGSQRRVAVDSESGEVIANPAMLAAW
jgi:hypothetical protein